MWLPKWMRGYKGRARIAAEALHPPRPRREPRTHDYGWERRGYGHDYVLRPVPGTNGEKARIQGWGYGLRDGDFILLCHPDHPKTHTTRYRLDHVRYLGNPPDMWTAEATFAPRAEGEVQATPAPKGEFV